MADPKDSRIAESVQIDIPKAPDADHALIRLNSRPIVPVRAIPHLTGWFIDVTDLPRILADKLGFPCRLFLTSFVLNQKNIIQQLATGYWAKLIDDFKERGSGLKKSETYCGANRTTWEQESISLIPADAFVWQSDLEELCLRKARHTAPIAPEKLAELSPDIRASIQPSSTGCYSGHLQFIMPIKERQLCLEAFQSCTIDTRADDANHSVEPVPLEIQDPALSYSTPAMEAMYAAINEFWIDYDPGQRPMSKQIVPWLQKNYNLSEQMAESIDRIIRPTPIRKGGNTKQRP